MKLTKLFFLLLFLFLTSNVLVFSVCAIDTNSPLNNPNLRLEDTVGDERFVTYEYLDPIVLEKEPEYYGISVFAVGRDGIFAIASELPNESAYYVCVFSNKGDFNYGFKIYSTCWFGLEFDDENLMFIFWDEDNTGSATCIDSHGNFVSDKKIIATDKFNHEQGIFEAYDRKELRQDKITYVLESESLLPTYTQLSKIEENGEKTLLFDTGKGSRELTKNIAQPLLDIWPAFVLTPILMVIFGVLYVVIKSKKKKDDNDSNSLNN